MKKLLPVVLLIIFSPKLFAQQFSLYNTGTLYDSFENPSQRAFIPDTSKKYASNFFIPNVDLHFFLSGDAQSALKSRLFSNFYDDSKLRINQNRHNLVTENGNAYVFMFKMFSSLQGDEEMGFSWQIKSEGKGLVSDETVAALNGPGSFADQQLYTNIFNGYYYYQNYNQFSFTYREQIFKQLAVGVKLSALLGIQYEELHINRSSAVFDQLLDTVGATLAGTYHEGYVPGHFVARDFLPTFRNPGAAISLGATYQTADHFIIQGNIKDLGFIHWSPRSRIFSFDKNINIQGLSSPAREDSIYNKVYQTIHSGNVQVGSFTTPIDGRAELSINKSFWINDNQTLKYSPTLIASKELFYNGFIAALVNPIQYQKYVFTVTTTYDDLRIFNLGAQFMMKTPNWEFYLGSERLFQSVSLLGDALNSNSPNISQNNTYTGMDFYLGFSLKFGPVIEHPMNASTIPMGEKGFLGRLWGRLFKTGK